MKVMKFGGTSLGSPRRVEQVCALVRQALAAGPVAVVVSAFGGVTNDLEAATGRAAAHDASYRAGWRALAGRHRDAAAALAAAGERSAIEAEIEARLRDLRGLLRGVYLLREASVRTRDSILAYGERLSAILVAAALRAGGVEAAACDARTLIRTDDAFGRARVDFEVSLAQARERLAVVAGVAVITGFVGATAGDETTTLGRGGSDYTAALIGAALDAEAIELWTDVDGVMSADPRQVAGAFALPHISYAELMELSHFGAKVVYPPTVHPARSRGIPLIIRNTLEPSAPGTRVDHRAPPSAHPIRGVSSIHRVSLLRLEGDGMVGVPGIAQRLFGALAEHGVSVVLISQASSEHSISFAVAPEDTAAARAAIDGAFQLERRAGMVDPLVVETEVSLLAVVGEALRERPGIAGRVFDVLGTHGVNVRAIAQGSSELNISLAVGAGDEPRALNAIHTAFFVPPRRRVRLALAGSGRVGSALLAQLAQAAPALAGAERLDLCLGALCNSRRLVLAPDGVPLDAWTAALDAGQPLELAPLLAFLSAPGEQVPIFVDCTASADVAGWYPALVAAGVHVVAANKRAFAGPLDAYRTLRAAARKAGVAIRHEATVGAGLPVVNPLRDLVRTGDRVERIDGVLSGTVNAILDAVMGGAPFSDAVRRAHAEGLTEPHPYDDLSGDDLARKLCILARLSGRPIELQEVAVAPVLDGPEWGGMPLETFWRRLPSRDAAFEQAASQARRDQRRLRYVATLDDDGARVAMTAVDAAHPAFDVRGAGNVIAIATARYRDAPLVVRGPGAGPEVTAAGVFADILAVAAGGRSRS